MSIEQELLAEIQLRRAAISNALEISLGGRGDRMIIACAHLRYAQPGNKLGFQNLLRSPPVLQTQRAESHPSKTVELTRVRYHESLSPPCGDLMQRRRIRSALALNFLGVPLGK